MSLTLLNHGFDHIEFVVDDIQKHASMYKGLGFEKVGERNLSDRGIRSEVYSQGFVRMMLTESKNENEYQTSFHKKHGDGICVLALEVSDSKAIYEASIQNGAKSALEPTTFNSSEGSVVRSEVWTPGDIRYAFIERQAKDLKSKALLDDRLVVDRLESPMPFHIHSIDHLTNNVSIGEMDKWVSWYKKIFDFKVTRHFNISTGRTGLVSDVVESQDRKVKVPINEASEPESQVQEFVERFHGPGVQHLAYLTTGIIDTLQKIKANTGIQFLDVPSTYYEAVPKRVPQFSEDLKVLEKLGILLDGEGEGYLLQIFTQELVGPFFFEFIQRKGNEGFGEGNFKALFEAIERDQIKRGVLSV